jgi:hypothetical protein
MCAEWAEPNWDSLSYAKHTRQTKRKWERSFARAESEGKKSRATYNPNLPRELVQRLEMECAEGTAGVLIRETKNQRQYYRDCTNEISGVGEENAIGASSGEFTNYIFVVYHISGSVHGYPITEDDLRSKKRVKL